MICKRIKLFFAAAALTLPALNGFSQSKNIDPALYSAAGIPDSLKTDANSVVRYSSTDVVVKGPGKMVITTHKIITVLNEKGDHEGTMVLEYNKKYDTFSDIIMRVYNDKGVVLKKYRKGDMYDGAVPGGDLVTDERFLGVRHAIATYPTTIEMEYEEDISSAMDIGRWFLQNTEQSVQNEFYHVQIDNAAGFRYISKNTNIKPEKKLNANTADYYWAVNNLKAFKLEDGAEPWRVLPHIYFAANNFEFFGVKGNLATWNDFGKFLQGLNADVGSLSPQREEEVRKMTDTIKSDKKKAEFLYIYLQKNMRYVSVQLGIGGFKPFPATFVDQQKYGDCKALSNYMGALLKAVNIPSCYAVVNAESNKEPADFSFPFNSFNHVILCVPFKGDTTWLECTSSLNKFGQLGPFTENRTALLITPDGGKLVNTPRSKIADNQFNSEAHITLAEDGSAKTTIKILATGEYRFDYLSYAALKLDEQKEQYLRMLNIKQPSMFNINSGKDADGIKEVDLDIEYDKFCDVMAGDKQFYRPRAFDLCAFSVPIEEKRKSDYYFEHPLEKSCVTTIDLPSGYEVETLPANQSLKFSYGDYDVKYVYDAAKNQVVSTAKFNITNHVIPAAKYTELQQYLDAVAKAQNKKLVIKRKA